MCRLLGITNFDYVKHKSLVSDFIDLAEIGMGPNNGPPGHKDGWGIAYYNNEGKAVIEKSGGSAIEERKLFTDKIESIGKTNILILHLRNSSWANTSTNRHSHPFEYNNLVLAHNGTINDFKKLLEKMPSINKPAADSLDTEVYLRFFASYYKGDAKEALTQATAFIKKNNEYTALNTLCSDGKKLVVLRHCAKAADYYTLYEIQNDGSHIVCSQKIGKQDTWKEIPQGKVLSF